MNEIYAKINEQTQNKYKNVRFSSLSFGKTAVATVRCRPSDADFLYANKAELTSLLNGTCMLNTPIAVEINASPITARELRDSVFDFIEKFNYAASVKHTVKAEVEPECVVKLTMHNVMHDLASGDLIPRLKEFLQNRYVEDVKINIDVVEYTDNGALYAPVTHTAPPEYSIGDCRPIVGSLKPDKAKSVPSISSPGYNVTACGVYAMPTEFTGKSGRAYEKFLLYDGDRVLQCMFFPNGDGSLLNAEFIGETVCVYGNVEYEGMRNEATMTVREMSLCRVDGLKAVSPRPEPADYKTVRPVDCEEFVQSSMFEQAQALPPALKGSFVVFDFETTGLSALYDKPTELGAVKVTDGKIVQSFSTLIDPGRPIPPEVAAKTGITDDMVKGKPLFEDVIPDFYKFSYGCGMVCHNIAFDYPFLLGGGNISGWAFGNRLTFDTMGMAPKVFPGINRLSLDKILEELGLVNDCAHRAAADAAATAKAFIAMHRRLAQKK